MMMEIDSVIENAIDEFSKIYLEQRKEAIESNKREKVPFMYFPASFWSESDVRNWFEEYFIKRLKFNRYKIHSEVTIDNSIFDTERFEKLKKENKSGWRVDLAVFPPKFKYCDRNSSAAILAEFTYNICDKRRQLVVNNPTKRTLRIVDKLEIEAHRLNTALKLVRPSITERGMIVCIDEELYELTGSNGSIGKRIRTIKNLNPRLRVEIFGTTLDQRTEWATS